MDNVFKIMYTIIIAILLMVVLPFMAFAETYDAMYDTISKGLVTVETDRGLSSGFIVDNKGLIITGYPITQSSVDFRVKLSKDKKVPAKLVNSYPEKGFSILYINPQNLKEKHALPFVISDQLQDIKGTVYAAGSPELDDNFLTRGNATDINEDKIITDVYINYNNAGGPLVNKNGEVIGINNFSEYFDQETPAVSNVITMNNINEPLIEALQKISSGDIQKPSAELIAVDAKGFYPANELKEAVNKNYYSSTYTYNEGPFKVILYSPPLYYNLAQKDKLTQHEIKKKNPRKQKAKQNNEEQEKKEPCTITKMNPYSLFNYIETLEDNPEDFKNYLIVKVIPKTGHTGGSSARGWLSFLIEGTTGCPVYLGSKTMEFKKDFYNMEIYVNGKLVQPVKRAREFNHNLYAEYFKDASKHPVTHSGLYLYNPSEIFNTQNGSNADIKIKVYQSDEKAQPTEFTVKTKTIKALTEDYEPILNQ